MPSIITDCSLQELLSIDKGDGCTKGGIQAIYAATKGDIDINSLGWDATGECNTSIAAIGAGGFVPIAFDLENTELTSSRAEGEGFYTNTITGQIAGRSKEREKALNRLHNICGLILYVIDKNCQAYLMGVQRNLADDGWELDDEPVQSTSDIRTTGLPNTRAQNDFVLTSKSVCPTIMTTVTLDQLPKK